MEVLSSAAYKQPHSSDSFRSGDLQPLREPDLSPGACYLIDDRPLDAVNAQSAEDSIATEPQSLPEKTTASQAWKVFGSTFVTIFLAELVDKTQLATLLMAAESHAPWIVFTGAATALITTSLLGVLVGRWLSSRISPQTLDTAAGVTLALLSVWLLWDACNSRL